MLILILFALTANYLHAQKLNQDTLTKYSQKAEQEKLFNRVAADIHLDAVQTAKFKEISGAYADKAIVIAKDPRPSWPAKLGSLKQLSSEYLARIKSLLSAGQFALLKTEREKYRFGRCFVTFSN